MVVVGLTMLLVWLFWWGRTGADDGVTLSNTDLADASVVLLCLILMLGPVAHFVPRMRPLVPWGRELGIAMFVTAALMLWSSSHISLMAGTWSRPSWVPSRARFRGCCQLGGLGGVGLRRGLGCDFE